MTEVGEYSPGFFSGSGAVKNKVKETKYLYTIQWQQISVETIRSICSTRVNVTLKEKKFLNKEEAYKFRDSVNYAYSLIVPNSGYAVTTLEEEIEG